MKSILTALALLWVTGTAHADAGAWAAYDALDVRQFTQAPRQATAVARLSAPVDQVWAYLANHENLPEYSGGVVQAVTMDHSQAKEPNGVGTRRECEAGKDQFKEEVVYFKAPYVFAYSAYENTWGLEGHLAVVSLRPDGQGGTLITWDQYFDHVKPAMAPKVAQNLRGMLRGMILPAVTKRFGGQVL